MQYQDFAPVFRHVIAMACMRQGARKKEAGHLAGKLTPHSMKVTFLNEAAHAGADDKAMNLQGHWADGQNRMALKYARNRMAIPARMIKVLVDQAKLRWHPKAPEEEVVDYDSGDEVEMYYLLGDRVSSIETAKYHVQSRTDRAKTACLRYLMERMECIGPLAPGESNLCRACQAKRPDLAMVPEARDMD